MSQEQSQEQVQPAAPEVGDIFADHMTEEAIGALLDDDKPDGGETPPAAQQPQPEAPKAEEQPKPAEEAPKTEGDGKYIVPLFGKDAELDGDQLVELAEAGAQLIQHRPQVEKAMTLLKAVEGDPQLQAILQAYANGQPLPTAQAQPVPQPNSPEEAVALFEQQVIQKAMQAIQQQYGPMVEKWNQTTEAYHQERAFAPFKSDPDYEAVNQCMSANVNEKLLAGQINHEQAAQIMGMLKSNPTVYGEWFPKFKDALVKARQEQARAASASRADDGKFVQRAPKLEGQAAAQADVSVEARKENWAKALSGDPAALGSLL